MDRNEFLVTLEMLDIKYDLFFANGVLLYIPNILFDDTTELIINFIEKHGITWFFIYDNHYGTRYIDGLSVVTGNHTSDKHLLHEGVTNMFVFIF